MSPTRKTPQTQTTEVEVPDRIHLTVAAICHHKGVLLMVEEKVNDQLVLNQPAGHVEPSESLSAAVIRETLEETGYQVIPRAILGLSVYRNATNVTFHRVSFLVTCINMSPRVDLDEEIERALWLSPEQILSAKNLRSPLVSLDVRRFLSGQVYPLEMLVENL